MNLATIVDSSYPNRHLVAVKAYALKMIRAAILGLKDFHLRGAMVGEAILQVDARQRRGQLPQVGRRSTNDAGKLAKGSVRRRNRSMRHRQDKVQPFGAVAGGLDTDVGRLHHPAAAALRPALHRCP